MRLVQLIFLVLMLYDLGLEEKTHDVRTDKVSSAVRNCTFRRNRRNRRKYRRELEVDANPSWTNSSTCVTKLELDTWLDESGACNGHELDEEEVKGGKEGLKRVPETRGSRRHRAARRFHGANGRRRRGCRAPSSSGAAPVPLSRGFVSAEDVRTDL